MTYGTETVKFLIKFLKFGPMILTLFRKGQHNETQSDNRLRLGY